MTDKTELDALVKLTEEFVTATWHLLDNSETSGPKDDPTITVWQPDFDEVSALLDRCEGLPNGSMEHIAAGELLAANLISAITTLRAQLAVAEACNRGLVRLNEATQDRADRAEIKLAKAEAGLREIAAEASVPVHTWKNGINFKKMYEGWRKIAVERIDIARATLAEIKGESCE